MASKKIASGGKMCPALVLKWGKLQMALGDETKMFATNFSLVLSSAFHHYKKNKIK
jgi:hypothetical protein